MVEVLERREGAETARGEIQGKNGVVDLFFSALLEGDPYFFFVGEKNTPRHSRHMETLEIAR